MVLAADGKRVMSGMRPSGRLHLGNYVGALAAWLDLQDRYPCYFAVADWHALTTGYDRTEGLRERIREMTLDWLAAGIDPQRSVVFVQSDVKEHAELGLLFSMITPLSWLERVPTYKDQLRNLEGREIATHGFLGYPVLQSADIAAYRASVVPVGQDQLPHLELTREIVRRFNHLYGAVFPEPEAYHSPVTVLPGLDNRKMSKSYDNTIALGETEEDLRRKVSTMITDPARIRKNDPGHPEVCAVYTFRTVFAPGDVEEIGGACRAGQIGCVACKRGLADALVERLVPLAERRREWEQRPGAVEELLAEGGRRAREVAAETLAVAREAVGVWA